jgi:hypothetical protein
MHNAEGKGRGGGGYRENRTKQSDPVMAYAAPVNTDVWRCLAIRVRPLGPLRVHSIANLPPADDHDEDYHDDDDKVKWPIVTKDHACLKPKLPTSLHRRYRHPSWRGRASRRTTHGGL